MNKAPAAILSDALTAFNKAATLALTTAQDQARRDVTQATTETRDARRERDDAVNTLHASRLEEQAWKQEASVWKAAAEQAELTINHHLETITQLREEASQWKKQCLRLEETSRQEATSWKEQFLRVENERAKLAQRVEELVTDQLSSGGHHDTSAPYTPMMRYSTKGDLTASTRIQRASALDPPSLQERLPSKSAPFVSTTTSSVNRTRPGPILQLPTPSSENQHAARQRAAQGVGHSVVPMSHGASQVLVRRVQAVVEVPIKEESVDREGVGPEKCTSTSTSNVATTSTSMSASASKTPSTNILSKTEEFGTTTRITRKASTKRTYVEIDDDDSEDASHNSGHNDGEEYQPISDGDDELLMGVEKNRNEVYGMKRLSKLSSVRKISHPPTPPLTVVKKRKTLPSLKKSRPSTASRA